LRSLNFPEESLQLNGFRLADYIRGQLINGELTHWTVYLATGLSKEVELAGRRVLSVKRTPKDDKGVGTDSRFTIGTALSPLDQAIDLSDEEFAIALDRTNRERSRSQPETVVPSGKSIRKIRGARPQNGLLIIYPIDPTLSEIVDLERPIISIVVSFPDSETADERVYRINSVEQRADS